jgi:hypothetical protein
MSSLGREHQNGHDHPPTSKDLEEGFPAPQLTEVELKRLTEGADLRVVLGHSAEVAEKFMSHMKEINYPRATVLSVYTGYGEPFSTNQYRNMMGYPIGRRRGESLYQQISTTTCVFLCEDMTLREAPHLFFKNKDGKIITIGTKVHNLDNDEIEIGQTVSTDLEFSNGKSRGYEFEYMDLVELLDGFVEQSK